MRSSFGIYVLCLGYVHVYGQLCSHDSVGHTVYGPGCKYLCHCKDNSEQCDNTTGSCVSGCAHEWMGPGCQYRDILWNKEAWQLGSNDAYKAVDERMDTCSSSVRGDGPIWWRAWFGQPEIIRGLNIVTDEAIIGHSSKLKVYVENNRERTNDTGFQLQEICYEHDGKSALTTTISITCVRPLKGNQLRIQLASKETRLCDVRMFGGRNLAYSKTTQQSSTHYDYVSSNAIDGDVQRCAVTTVTYPPHTWTVDLGDIVHVQAIQLISSHTFSSTDTIQVGVDSYSYPVQFTPSEVKTYFFTSDVDARYLQFKRITSFISLCEVLIYGECLEYKCGLDCSIPCHCAVFTFENKVFGECLEGCAVGWTGQGHRCDTECNDGTYGINCSKLCSGHCVDNGICEKVHGHCPRGCAAGWMGDKCDAVCSHGSYGVNCSDRCSSHCHKGGLCDKTNGRCEGGCKAGWQGLRCLTVQDEQNNRYVVVGTIVAVLALLGIVILAVVAYRRFCIPSRRSKRHTEQVPVQSSDETAHVNRMIVSGLDSVDRLALRNRTCDNADQSRQQHAAALAEDGCEYHKLVEGTAPIVKMPEHGILLTNLIRFLEDEKHHPGKLAAEFAEIPTIADHSCLEAQKSSNKHKNKYQQMYPYDHNRVILHTVGSDPSSDYINASHIDGYKLRDAFIAAQGTTKANIGDFWRLIWEKKIKVIIMLTELYEQGKMKCERYWDPTGSITFGEITVTVQSEEQFAEFTIRTFQANSVGNKTPLLVQQYHFTAWPDKACPDGTASLLCFWGRVNKDNPKSDIPWLVHCSFQKLLFSFIALDILISQGRDTGYVDVYGCVKALRQQRVFMVQTKIQYIYLHELLADALVLHSLPVSTYAFLRHTSSRASHVDSAWNAVKEHMMVGDNRSGNDNRSKSGVMPENILKNRLESIVPVDQYRPYLSITSAEGNNYINAVYMPSYRRKHGLILTQTPLPTTTADWWRLVHQHKIQTVLAFDDTPTNENTGLCFPMDPKLKNGQFQTRQLSFEQDRGFTISKHNLSYEGTSRELTYLQFQKWPNDQLVPSDSVTMLHFCQEVLNLQNQHLDSPLLIQCFDGATRSGLMAVLLNALDRLCVEEEVAVLQILHHLRLRRPQIVPNKEQLQFCYDVIRHHLQDGSTYANL